MSEADVYTIFSDAIWTILIASSPILAIATIVGLGIAFFQALTQVQEMTLTFVPKIAAIFVALVAAAPFMYATLSRLSETVFDLIVAGGL